MGETTKWKETYHNDYHREIRTMASSTSDRIWKIITKDNCVGE